MTWVLAASDGGLGSTAQRPLRAAHTTHTPKAGIAVCAPFLRPGRQVPSMGQIAKRPRETGISGGTAHKETVPLVSIITLSMRSLRGQA